MKNILNCHGRRFSAEINGVRCKGIITVEWRRVFLCQNEQEGNSCDEKHGYRYSWEVTLGGVFDLESRRVTDFKLLDEEPETKTGDAIEEAINLLKSNGYKILKPEYKEL